MIAAIMFAEPNPSEISLKELNDLLATGFFLALAVAVLASIIDSRLKKWYEDGKTYKAWITFGLLMAAALGCAIAVRVFPAFKFEVTPRVIELPIPTGPLRSHPAGPSLFHAQYSLSVFLFILMFVAVGFFIRKMTDREPYTLENIVRYIADGCVGLVVTTTGIVLYRLLAFTVGAIPLSQNPGGVRWFLFLLVCCLFLSLTFIAMSQQLSNLDRTYYHHSTRMRVSMIYERRSKNRPRHDAIAA
jgi:hypothetical protein